MKRQIALLAAIAVCSLTVQASADPVVLLQESGTILFGNPATRDTGGVSETLNGCGESIDQDVPAGTGEGVDGYWVFLGDDPRNLWEQPATLTSPRTLPSTPAPVSTANDVDAWFYDSTCALIKPSQHSGAYHMATTGSPETGVIPTGAQWVAVDLYRGVNASFTFTVYE